MTTAALSSLTEARGRQQGLNRSDSCPSARLRRSSDGHDITPAGCQNLSGCHIGMSPYAYKRKDQGPLREGWPRRDEDGRDALLGPLASLSRVDACNPLLQAHPTWARDEHEGREIPTSLTPVTGRLAPSPLRARPRARPIWAGARSDTHSSARGIPRSQNADTMHP
jgi:hypothetical protein